MAISNLVLTQQIYSEETNAAHAHYREPVPLTARTILNEFQFFLQLDKITQISAWDIQPFVIDGSKKA